MWMTAVPWISLLTNCAVYPSPLEEMCRDVGLSGPQDPQRSVVQLHFKAGSAKKKCALNWARLKELQHSCFCAHSSTFEMLDIILQFCLVGDRRRRSERRRRWRSSGFCQPHHFYFGARGDPGRLIIINIFLKICIDDLENVKEHKSSAKPLFIQYSKHRPKGHEIKNR